MNDSQEPLLKALGTRKVALQSWLGRPIEAGVILVPPSPRLDGDALVMQRSGRLKERRIDGARVLDEFVGLASGADVLRFARKYGNLGLCAHGLPALHPVRFPRSSMLAFELLRYPDIREWIARHPETDDMVCFGRVREPVAAWLALSRRAEEVLKFVAALRLRDKRRSRKRVAPPAHVQQWFDALGRDPAFRPFRQPWRAVAETLGWWLDAADIGVQLAANNSLLAPQFQSASRGIFGVIAIQLLLAATKAEGLAVCDGCQRPYQGLRPPMKGKQVGPHEAKRNFCQECKKRGVPHRLAARDWWRTHHGPPKP